MRNTEAHQGDMTLGASYGFGNLKIVDALLALIAVDGVDEVCNSYYLD